MAKPALGRGLGALLGGTPALTQNPPPTPAFTPTTATTPPAASPTTPAPAPGEQVHRIPITRIRPCPLQPRKDFPPDSLRELADSIREKGIVQPLIVRDKNGQLELIAGERRLRAAQLAGLTDVPVIIRQADDRAVLEMALIENLQRENLNPIEEAQGFAQLLSQFQLTQEEAAARVGKSRAAVANALRLLKLPDAVQKHVREGRLSAGHAKAILALPTEKLQRRLAERVIKAGLNVRQTEALVAKLTARHANPLTPPTPTRDALADPNLANLENRLRERLATRVKLHYQQGTGTIEISFFSDDELHRLLDLLGVKPE
ncbi:MAG: ParB/RepB/Spo0J family partition protein [Verrucomicrobiales bacterium]|nr:ParB/RepB/Spo0J family partition protein [Verrucomicrobiales bacterium]